MKTNSTKNPSDIPYFEDADSAPKPGVPVVERDAINAIVYNPRTGKVICLDWQKFGWHTFVIGGIEAGENAIDAATREIAEETGYKHLRVMATLGKTRSGYYAAHKGENRISNATALLFVLTDDARDEVPNAANLPHVFTWLPRSEVAAFLTLSAQKYIWEKAQDHLAKI